MSRLSLSPRTSSLTSVALALTLFAAPGRAQAAAGAAGAPPAVSEATSPPSAPAPTPEVVARELYRLGSLSYEEARYDDAIARFTEAYRLSRRPALLFNIAQAYRLKGPAYCATALQYYQRDLSEEPATSNRREIEELSQEMRGCAATGTSAAPVSPALSAIPTSVTVPAQPGVVTSSAAEVGARSSAPVPSSASRWPTWLAAAGGGIAVIGLVGHGVAWSKYRSVRSKAPVPTGTYDGWQTFTEIADVTAVAGGALAATGLLVLWSTSGEPADARVAVGVPFDRRPGVGLVGRF